MKKKEAPQILVSASFLILLFPCCTLPFCGLNYPVTPGKLYSIWMNLEEKGSVGKKSKNSEKSEIVRAA